MDIQFHAATDVGRKREQNEDNFLIDPRLRLFVVADGMGGHAAGEVASRIAVHELDRAVRDQCDLIEGIAERQSAETLPELRLEILRLLEGAVQQACATVFQAGERDPDKRGMATTCSALLLVGDRGYICHVGDSRIYLLRQGQVHQITEDHSLVNELVRRGKLRRDQIDDSPYAKFKNAVTRAVGAHETVAPDLLDFDLLPGDQFLLCSDGMYAYFEDADLPALLAAPDLASVPPALVAHANAGGGHDNITALVVRVGHTDAEEAAARVRELQSKMEALHHMPFFHHLGYKEIMRVLNIAQVRDYQPGERILVEGEAGEELFVLVDGRVRLEKGGAAVATLGRGAHFGEMALVDRAPRSATVVAEEATRALVIGRRAFYTIIRDEPRLATRLLWSFVQVLTERLRRTTAELSGTHPESGTEQARDGIDVLDDKLAELLVLEGT